jgi:carboxylesterase
VLLVHGFTGTPFEMRLLGEHLAQRGYAVSAPLLAGHRGTTAELAATRWPDWLASVEHAFDALLTRCERAAVVGLSLGGLLTLELARRRRDQIAALALLSTALWLPPAARRFSRVAQSLPGVRTLALPTIAGSDISDRAMRAANKAAKSGAGMPLAALQSLIDFGDYLKPWLGDITQPALIMHARHDHTIPFECSAYLLRALGSADKKLVALERSFHVITLDLEREQVFEKVAEHVSAHAG